MSFIQLGHSFEKFKAEKMKKFNLNSQDLTKKVLWGDAGVYEKYRISLSFSASPGPGCENGHV